MRAGDRLGRYELIAEIGRGGMAAVWDADLLGPRGFRKRVALKVLHADVHVADADALVHEARLGALVNHPNVVATLELGEEGGRWFLCMERVAGTTAQSLIAERPLSAAAVLDLGVQVASGLRHLHDLVVDGAPRPLVHRDIKPSNLLVDPHGLVKIADLGISGFRDQLGSPAGTPGYAPAEQIDGRAVPRSDVFALACTLYVLATRQRLLGKGTEALARAATIEGVIRRAAFGDALDAVVPGLAALLRTCLRLDPEARPDSGQLADDLRRLRLRVEGQGLAHAVGGVSAGQPVSSSTRSRITRNLPEPGARPVGRKKELRALGEALARRGVVALTGLAGAGKTLLASVAAGRCEADESWWVACGGCTTASALLAAIAATLGFGAQVGIQDAHALAAALRDRGEVLVVLDDLEGRLSEVVVELARDAPSSRWLVTSRQKLRGVAQIHVGPLDGDAAVALYRQHASDAAADEVVLALVDRLDRSPLAIELAAARTRHLSTARILAALDDRFRVLRDGHRGLWESLLASWEHLPPDARTTLAQIAPFEGSFTLEDAEAVVRLDGNAWVLDALSELVDHHLLDSDGHVFAVSSSVRAFALQHAPQPDAVFGRHVAWLAQLGAPEALQALDRAGGAERFQSLRARQASLSTALEWALEHAPADAVGLSLALAAVIERTGPMEDGVQLVRRALSAEHTPSSLVRLLEKGALFSFHLGQVDQARSLCATGIQAADHAESPVAGELHRRIAALEPTGSTAALGHLAEAERHARASGDMALLARVTNNLGIAEPTDRRERYERALELARGAGAARVSAMVLGNLAILHWHAGRYDDADRAYREAVRDARACGDVVLRAYTLANYVALHLDRGDLDEAKATAEQADRLYVRLGLVSKRSRVLSMLGGISQLRGDPASARRYYLQALSRLADDPVQAAAVVAELAELLLVEGDADGAWARIDALRAVGPEHVERVLLAVSAVRVQLARGQIAGALAELTLARSAAASFGSPSLQARVACAAARYAVAVGEDGRPHLLEARRLAEPLGLVPAADLSRELAAVSALVG
jgi:predicted ATPase/Tfp pilus assembly protein PilF